MRLFFVLLFASLLFAGAANAIINATLGSEIKSRWTGTSGAASSVTEGGNITYVNISGATQLTSKWASFYGLIQSATIALRSSTATVYSWSYSPANGSGEVCLSSSNSFPGPITSLTGANLSAMNSLWNLGTIDNATNTFNTTSSINISGQVVSGAPAAKLQGSSTFTVVALFNSTTSSKNAFAFCTQINNSGKNFQNSDVHYEIMVPTTPGAAETYYFYLELDT
ncbi:MAG: hypothetical protein QXN37_01900 [Candidatus Anstonellaceae archaeon]